MQATDEITQLQAGIAALEAQRAILGDAVVEAMLGPIREKLAALQAQADHAAQQRKLATVLFMDIAGHTALIRDLDPEENMALIDAALARLAEPVGRFGGHVARYQGDGFKAVFGLPTAHEDDPENAIRAALDIQAVAHVIGGEWSAERGVEGFRVRLGIDTGLVFAGGLTEGEDTVKGMPVNLAARLESAAEPGTILISHNTY
ncbi:adenylate/guanylate cyclase domain-containing protein, partial [Promineifilum sp.]|uniref:adenylate/guanylate cyclase domain-containing protein n=1 Tax=Promineifilum sp. TaxID=2664178 RepID=UPI0035B056C8